MKWLRNSLAIIIYADGCHSFLGNYRSTSTWGSINSPPFRSSLSALSETETSTATSSTTSKTRTQRIMENMPGQEGDAGGAGSATTYSAFLRAEENWKRLRDSTAFNYDSKLLGDQTAPPPIPFVTEDGGSGSPACWDALREVATENSDAELDYDVVVCGGTLGIFIALSLQNKGHKVCVLEGGELRGREQEWNISMNEMEELMELGVLTQQDIDEAVTTEFPGCRSGFKNKEAPTTGGYFENGIGYEVVTPNVLNLGVSPDYLIRSVGERFQKLGGIVLENTRLKGVVVSERVGAALDIGESAKPITAKLVLDCMGNASPISRQQRYGKKPDGVCAVVGTCAGGYDPKSNTQGDIIYTNTEIQDKGNNGQLQYFWEAFPVGIGRNGITESDIKTTYMFTYMDADSKRPPLSTIMDDYWDLLPIYQPSISDPETDLDIKRVLFAYFPTYRDSPLQPAWSRVLAVGDASGIQSPLSFGGFGALTRHLGRISTAVSEALVKDCLHKDDLGLVNAYRPDLSVTWMFQKAMSIRMKQRDVDPKFVNRLLASNFQIMNDMGMDTIKPFLQDVVRLDGLIGSLARSFVADPLFTPEIVGHVGIPLLVDWLGHLSMLALYTVLHNAVSPALGLYADVLDDHPRQQFQLRRKMEAWKFGSGSDYQFEKDE